MNAYEVRPGMERLEIEREAKLSVDKSAKNPVAPDTAIQVSVKPEAVEADVVKPVGAAGMVRTAVVLELVEFPAALIARIRA